MTQRLLVLAFLGVFFALAPPAEAQQAPREGFIIGIGVGPGLMSIGGVTRESDLGFAVDFHIGGVVSDGIQIYYMNKSVFLSSEGFSYTVTGMTGVGVTYPLSSIDLKGGIGVSVFANVDADETAFSADSETGLGLMAGARYGLSQRWGLDFDLMYGSLDFGSVYGATLTINVLSH